MGLKVENFRTDGTSNYVANLNYHGQTWAAALRMPAKGASFEEFLVEKNRALNAVQYLISVLKDGIDVGFDCTLNFAGVSCLVENSSTQNYLQLQAREKPLFLIDQINHIEKIIQGFDYPEALADDARQYVSNYTGPFYLSRGAPAWETLEDYPELEEPVAHALATLHLITGQGTPVPFETALGILSDVEPVIYEGAERWLPTEGSKEALALTKSLKKWKANDAHDRIQLIRLERFMRTSAGQKLFQSALNNSLKQYVLPDHPLKSFCHGDCHGGNFILVRYQYVLNRPEILLDRVFLNEIFEKDNMLDNVTITIDEGNSSIIHGLSTMNPSSLIATRKFHHEIHLIDLDNGQGTTESTKVIHLYDALLYALSLANVTRLFASPIDSSEVLRHYYAGLESRA
jgi:hypothetical protein